MFILGTWYLNLGVLRLRTGYAVSVLVTGEGCEQRAETMETDLCWRKVPFGEGCHRKRSTETLRILSNWSFVNILTTPELRRQAVCIFAWTLKTRTTNILFFFPPPPPSVCGSGCTHTLRCGRDSDPWLTFQRGTHSVGSKIKAFYSVCVCVCFNPVSKSRSSHKILSCHTWAYQMTHLDKAANIISCSVPISHTCDSRMTFRCSQYQVYPYCKKLQSK